ncbi:PP2C family protein-serine/threonine phosphatase [Streptomyces sp. NPDC005574]|uniref:PP2C family protein-serine/threonine phosphatase n=1 Tax=Streptomyces sp. NPDC005574 TaxID=3156891 RepID=UPI0033BCB1D7
MTGDRGPGPTGPADPFALAGRAVGAIGSTLDDRRTAVECARFLVGELCEAAAVDLFPQDEVRRAEHGGPLRPAAAEGRHDLLASLHGVPRADVLVRALDAGRPITASLAARAGGVVAALSVPLLARGRVYGAVLAVRTDRAFADDEAAAVHYVARLTAAHLHHALDHHRLHGAAQHLQQALLAEPGRPHPNVDMATRYLPAGSGALVGGDWFEAVRLHYGRTLLVIGDVMGHGLDAAVDMNAYRSMLRYVASTDLPPHRILSRMDTVMSEEHNRRPATCLLALLDPSRGTVALAGAGHLPPALFHPDGTGALVDLPVGPPLGTGLAEYDMTTLTVRPDDTLVMFTDGLVERRGEDIDTSLDRLARLQLSSGQGVTGVLDEILLRLDAGAADDDVAVVTARLRGRPA